MDPSGASHSDAERCDSREGRRLHNPDMAAQKATTAQPYSSADVMQFLRRVAKTPQVLKGLDSLCSLVMTERKVHTRIKHAAQVGYLKGHRALMASCNLDHDLNLALFQSPMLPFDQATSDYHQCRTPLPS